MRKAGFAGSLGVVALVATVLLPALTRAAVPYTIGHQGYLTDAGGPVNRSVSIVFSLYDVASGGAALWTETQSVPVNNGVYSVTLGGVTPIIPATVLFNKKYWLGVKIDADAEMTPRAELTSVGYAFRANVADSVATGAVSDAQITGPISGSKVSSVGLNAESLGGTPAASYLKTGTITDSGGKVGIGTAPGQAELSVASTSGFMGDYSSSASWGVLRLQEGSTLRSYLGFGDSGGFMLNSVADSTGLYAVTGALHLTANVDATKGITVLPTGKVGIGTTAPTSVLHAVDPAVSNDSPAVYGEHAVTDYYGIGVKGKGGFRGVEGTVTATGNNSYLGVYGTATTSGTSGSTYGGYFAATATGTGTAYGGYFNATGGANNYGVYSNAGKNYFNGYLGLNTTAPGARLHLKGTGYPDSFMFLEGPTGQDTGFRFYENGADKSHLFWSGGAQTLKLYGSGYSGLDVTSTGSVGVGTQTPADKLHVWGNFLRVEGAGGEKAYIGGDGAGGDVQVGSMNAAVTAVAMYNGASSKYMALYAGELHIMGGADLAEPFDSAEPKKLEAGMLAAIDSANPGQLTLADTAYDRKVAGVVSGANGIKPGVTMAQAGTAADGTIPLALAGRVYAWADASYGAIEPGDLLTTSDTPGHAMKVTDHAKAQGAIVGKAMSGLSEGRGLILVLVTLQ